MKKKLSTKKLEGKCVNGILYLPEGDEPKWTPRKKRFNSSGQARGRRNTQKRQ